MSSESLKSLIVTDPDLVDPELDVSGLRTQTDTDPRLLASIADFPGISYDPTQFSYLTDLNELFAYGLPVVDTGTTTPETGTGGGGTGDGGQATVPGAIDTLVTPSANTPEEQRLIDAGIGVQGAPGDPVVAPGEIPVTQQQLDDFNQIPVTPVNEFTTGDASLAEQIAAEDRAAQLANVQDPTTMLPQLGTDTPTVFDGTATLEDAGAGEGGMQLAEVGLGAETDFTPSSTYDEAGLQIAEAPFGINPATGKPYQTPRTIADQNRVLGVVTEEDAADPKGLLEKIGLTNFDPARAAVMSAINLAVGKPVSLLVSALQALPEFEPTFEQRTLTEELGLTDDRKFAGDPTKSAFAGLNAYGQFGDPVETAKNRIDTRLETIENNPDISQKFIDDTQTMIEEYNRVTNKLGDIDSIPTGDAQIAEETIGTLPEITEARQKQGEQIQEIEQQKAVDTTTQSGRDEADRQQENTGVAKVETNQGTRYETSSGDRYASAAEAAEKSDGGSSDRGGGCVIATHAVNSGAFTKNTKREAVRWCVKNLHRTWWGEAIRRGYRYYGQKAIEEGKAKNHYQEFKDYVAFGTGKRRTLKTGWTFVYRSIQFFIRGLING